MSNVAIMVSHKEFAALHTNEIPFIEDTCVQCGNPVKDSGPSHCNSCGQGPFCVQHMSSHARDRASWGGCWPVRGL